MRRSSPRWPVRWAAFRLAACVGCAALLWAPSTSARHQPVQAAQQPLSSVVVTVIDGASREPIDGATVRATAESAAASPGQFSRGVFSQASDANGHASLGSLPPGRYWIRADKSGYFPAVFGCDTPTDPGTAYLRLQASDRRQITIVAWKFSAIAGTVLDDRQQPIVGAQVQVLRRTSTGWLRAELGGTDDRGDFRISPLGPGDYLAALLASSGSASGIGATFYPEAQDAAGATVIRLGPGEERRGITIERARRPAEPVFRVAGRVTGAAAGITVHLTQADTGESLGDFRQLGTITAADGTFGFSGVPAGEYQLEALSFPAEPHDVPLMATSANGYLLLGVPPDGGPLAALSAEPTLAAGTSLTVSGDAGGLVLDLRPCAHFRGRVVFDGSPAPDPAQLPRFAVLTRPATSPDVGRLPQARVEPGATFQSAGLPPGDYVVAVERASPISRDLADWAMSSVQYNGRNVVGESIALDGADVDLVITLTTRLPRVAGTVLDATGRPDPYARVIVFPVDEARWNIALPIPARSWIAQTTADEDGAFDVPVLPGRYFVAAVRSLPASWKQPEFLKTLVPSRPLAVDLGDRTNVVVRIAAGGGRTDRRR